MSRHPMKAALSIAALSAALLGCQATIQQRSALLAMDETNKSPAKSNAVILVGMKLLSKPELGRISFSLRGNGDSPSLLFALLDDAQPFFLPFTRSNELVAYEVPPGWVCVMSVQFGDNRWKDKKNYKFSNIGSKDLCFLARQGQATYIGDFLIQRTADDQFKYERRMRSAPQLDARAQYADLRDWEIVSSPAPAAD
ncbi:MAG TPA: hypothetical protein H9903_02340 [Candidatus Aquabacterium excrementipullorum]|nr:hypothetical protein [Candidatus Aquabacterium excrementipullorum]